MNSALLKYLEAHNIAKENAKFRPERDGMHETKVEKLLAIL